MAVFKKVEGQGEDVVILSGWGGVTHEHMQPIADLLSKNYRVTTIDLPGLGRSDWEPTINNTQDFVEVLLPHLPERAIYIGWSFGGLLIMALAAKYPERVKRLIGIATSPYFIEDKDWIGIPKPGFTPSFSTGLKQGYKNFFLGFINNEFPEIHSRPQAYDQLIKILEKNPDADIEVLLKGIAICDKADMRKEFESLNCPIDLIFGEKDAVVPKEAYEKIRQLNPKTNIYLIPKAQHLFFWTHPEQFNKILLNILS